MSYRLETTERPVDGVRRIAREQLGGALSEIENLASVEANKAVHEARKHIKKVRALLRLVCDEIGEEIFAEENRRLRDVAHSLSGARDAQMQMLVLEKLRVHARQEKRAFRKTAAALKCEIAAVSTDLSAQQQTAQTTLQWIGDRIEGWPLDELSLESLCSALKRFYRRARQGLRCAESNPTAENFHSWRKRVKDVWYQSLLLQNLNPAVMCELADAARTLGRQLGDLHDLAFFRARLETEQHFPESERTVLLALLRAREREMEETALDLGARFFAEKSEGFEKRLLRYARRWPARAAVA